MKILRKLTVLWTVLALLAALIISPNVSHAADSTVIMPEATVGQAYNATETVTLTGEIQGHKTVVNWPDDGLVGGIENISGNTWKFSVSGTPTVTGTRSVTYETTTERKTFTLKVNTSGSSYTVNMSEAIVGQAYNGTITLDKEIDSRGWSNLREREDWLDDELPYTVTYDSSISKVKVSVTGVPRTERTNTFTIEYRDRSTITVNLKVNPAIEPETDTVNMPDATVGHAYNETKTVTLYGEIQNEKTVVNWPDDGLAGVIENISGNTWKFSVSGTPTVTGTRSVTYETTTDRKIFTLTVNPAKTVTLSGGANATASGGSTSQTGLAGALEPVTYTANTGYKFGEFTDITSNGITVTRTSDTVVTVSGTPTADVNITVPDAVAKTQISAIVTFKVVNGSWSDETIADKTVTLTGYEGDTLKLTADQIPAVGNKPNDGYQAGSWDVTPSTETAITGATTYTYTYSQRSGISQTVTFRVSNGAWNDETTSDKTVILTGYEGDTLKLASEQIPAVGNKPNDGYQAGGWDVTPSTETAITRATTYTYTYSAREVVREAATVTRTPSANNLTFNEQAQELVTAGEASGGTINYVLGENATTAPASGWGTTIPTGTNAGTYFVWFMAKGDADHNDSQASCVTVTINEASETPDTPETPAVTITTGNFTLVPNGTRQLEVTVVPQGSAVAYSSSNPAVATIDQNGRVTAVAEGRAVITAKITVDGTDYTSTCTVAVTGNAQPTRSDEIPAHVHSYVWDTREATESEDGEYRYQCSVCGDIQTRVPITAYYTFNKNTAEKIRKAKQGETIKIETARWISFHKIVADAMKDRPDVTLNISFLDQGHKGVPYTMTIPAGTDMESLLDEHGFAGFLYLGGKYGMTAR